MKKSKLAYVIVATLIMTSCGSKSESTAMAPAPDYATDTHYTEEMAPEESYNETATSEDGAIGFNNAATELKREQMFSKVGTINNVTEDLDKNKKENGKKEFEEIIVEVERSVDKYNGFFESATYKNDVFMYFESTIKVPVKDFENLFKELKSLGVNVNNESSVENETAGYYSTKSQLEIKKVSKARLEETIKTTTNTKDLLKLYDSYYELVSQIEIAEANLRNIESETSYSTILFSLSEGSKGYNEHAENTDDEESFTSKVKDGFGASIYFIENIIIGIAYISVPLVLITLVLLIGYKKVKPLLKGKSIKEQRRKKQEVVERNQVNELNGNTEVNKVNDEKDVNGSNEDDSSDGKL